jgi:hypothetical protein
MAVLPLHVHARVNTAILAELSGIANAVAKAALYGDFLLIELTAESCHFHTLAAC